MKKEAVSYIKHILRSDFVQLDVLNTLLALFIIIFAFIALAKGGSLSYFGAVFVIGGVLALFNLIKSIMKKSYLSIVVFSCGLAAMTVASVVVYAFLM